MTLAGRLSLALFGRRRCPALPSSPDGPGGQSGQDKPPSLKRVRAVDVLRGLTMAFMVLVNNPGNYHAIYWPLQHSEWHGSTPVDFVFPLFLFVVGLAVPLSTANRRRAGECDDDLVMHAFRRATILFCLGLVDNGFPYFDLASIRIPGVLQRIGIVSFLVTVVNLRLRTRTMAVLFATLVLAWWGLLVLVPVPGFGPPDLAAPTGNLPAWLDHRLLGGHLWVREDEWDPEGILSTVPACCIALAGVMAGRRLQAGDAWKQVASFLSWGGLLVLAGLVWSIQLPINRWLWTSSFTMVAAGICLLILALCRAAELAGWDRLLRPFTVFGSNAVVIYLVSSLLAKTLYFIRVGNGESLLGQINKTMFAPWLSPHNASLAWALVVVLAMYGLARGLRARNIFVKL